MNTNREQENVLLSITNLKDLVLGLREELPSILQPLNLIQDHLNQLSGLEEIHSLRLDINEKDILERAVDGLIDRSDTWTKIIDEVDILISDIENWKEDIDEDDEDTIDLVDGYLSDLEKIQGVLDTTEIDFDEYDTHLNAVDDMLSEVFTLLQEFMI